MVLDEIEKLTAFDPEVGEAIRAEYDRQRGGLELIASENVVSDAVMLAAGSILTNKYAEGYPDHRYYGGCACVDRVEKTAIERAKQLFGAEHVNVQPHSGAQTNTAVYVGLLEHGDTVMGMNLAADTSRTAARSTSRARTTISSLTAWIARPGASTMRNLSVWRTSTSRS